MDRTSREKMNKDTSALNMLNYMDLTDIYRIYCPKTTEYRFFSSTHGIFFKIRSYVRLQNKS